MHGYFQCINVTRISNFCDNIYHTFSKKESNQREHKSLLEQILSRENSKFIVKFKILN